MALNRPSYTSSLHLSQYLTHGWPSFGNDGDKLQCNGSATSHSVVHTLRELNPWYGVDLGVKLRVAGVKLTNRDSEYAFAGE